jgi:GDP-4-dehydro-6-deoxy-D-mannose reductase
MNNCVLITGIHGFCARHLLNKLIAERIDNIYGADIHQTSPEKLDLKNYLRLNIADRSAVNNLICSLKPDTIFNLAGLTSAETSELYYVNFMGSVYLLEAVRKWVPQAKLLLVGSAAEYGYVPEVEMPISEKHSCKPLTPYGISKYAMTLSAINFAKEHGVKVLVARPFNIVGAGMPSSLFIGAVLKRIKKVLIEGNKPAVVAVGNLNTERDFIAVEDMADSYLAMIRSNCWGEVFNVCSGKPFFIRDILKSLLKNSKEQINFQVNAPLVRVSDLKCVYGSGEKATRLLGFKPRVPLEDALKAAWDAAIGEDA